MSVVDLSASTQNYLKAIWNLQEWSDEPVTASTIAQKTGLKISTASGSLPKLADQGLVEHARYGSVGLTAVGREYAVAMVRRHRLIETFLVEVLGYGWDQVHDEAEILEHAVSEFMIGRIDEVLAHPVRDPHGDPIPSASGSVDRALSIQNLTHSEPGSRLVVERISDDDPELLRFFADRGLVVGTQITASAGPPYSDSLQVQVGDVPPIVLGRAATDAVWVSLSLDPPTRVGVWDCFRKCWVIWFWAWWCGRPRCRSCSTVVSSGRAGVGWWMASMRAAVAGGGR